MNDGNCKKCCYFSTSEECEGWWMRDKCMNGDIGFFESRVIYTVPQWKFTKEDLEIFETYCDALNLKYKDMLHGLIYNEEWFMTQTVDCVNHYFDTYRMGLVRKPEYKDIGIMKYGDKI